MSLSIMLVFAVLAISVFVVDGSRSRLRSSQNIIRDARPHHRGHATLVQQPAMFASELSKGPVGIHGLAGNSGTYPDESDTLTEAAPPSAESSSHEDEVDDDTDSAETVEQSTDTGPKPPAKGTTQTTDFSGETDYDNDNDADSGDATDYLQATPSNHSEALTMQEEQETGVTPAPPTPDPNTEQIDLPFVVYPGYAKLEKEKLEKMKLAKQQKLHNQTALHNQTVLHNQTAPQIHNMSQSPRSPDLVKSQIVTGTKHITTGGGAKKKQMPKDPKDQPGWGQPVGILRPKGWEQCLKFAKYTVDEGYKGVALVRVWKSLCEPAVLSGSATERYRLMCVSLSKSVTPYATMDKYRLEDICDSVLTVVHDISAVDTPFAR